MYNSPIYLLESSSVTATADGQTVQVNEGKLKADLLATVAEAQRMVRELSENTKLQVREHLEARLTAEKTVSEYFEELQEMRGALQEVKETVSGYLKKLQKTEVALHEAN